MAGRIDDYIRSLNRILRDYSQSPAKNATVRELIENTSNDQGKGRISYERGAAIALWLDAKIRRNTQEKSSLDDLMFDLFRENRNQKDRLSELTPERVFKAASRYIDPNDVTQLRSYAEQGTTVEAPMQIRCAKREMVELSRFDLGMNRAALLEKHIVADLQQGSEAQRAGLQEGDQVMGTSVYWNDVSKLVKLTILRNKATLKMEYYPRGQSLGLMPQYVVSEVGCLDLH